MKKRIGIVFACALSLTLVFTGCGSSSDSSMGATSKQMPVEAESAVYDNAAEAAPAQSGADPSSQVGEVADTSRKLITTVNISTETEALDDTISKLCKKVDELGGYIESSNIYNGSRYSGATVRNADYIIRIPADKLNSFVETVDGVTNITNKSTSVEDVTLSYVDIESRKKALKAEEESLLGILESAEKIEDIIAVQERLSEVRYQMESIESQLRTYDNKVDYSTVYLSIQEVVQYTETQQKGAFQRMGEGFVKSLKSVGNGLKEFFIMLVINIPQIVLLAAIVFAVIFIVRRSNKKKTKPNINIKDTEGKDGK